MECKQSIVIFNHQVLTDVLLFTHLLYTPLADTSKPNISVGYLRSAWVKEFYALRMII